MRELFIKCLKISAPLVYIPTPDIGQTISEIEDIFDIIDIDELKKDIITWNACKGLGPEDDPYLQEIVPKKADPAQINDPYPPLIPDFGGTVQPVDALGMIGDNPPVKKCVILLNAHALFGDIANIQAIWNLRDIFKSEECHSILVMIGQEVNIPPELKNDVVTIDHEAPGPDAIEEIISGMGRDSDVDVSKQMERAIQTVNGLPAFAIETQIAMAMTKNGLDLGYLAGIITEETNKNDGLTMVKSKLKFEDLQGCENWKKFMELLMNGPMRPGVILILDECADQLGSGSKLDDVGRKSAGIILTRMEQMNYMGTISLGPPGVAKTYAAICTGGEYDIETILFSLSEMEDSLVGSSQRNLLKAMKFAESRAQGKPVFCIGTCNSFVEMRPQLRRRFNFPHFFFDMPTDEELNAILQYHMKQRNLPDEKITGIDGWTGAEVRNCALLAEAFNKPFSKAQPFIIPQRVSATNEIEEIRKSAHKKFLSANHDGWYEHTPLTKEKKSSGKRKIVSVGGKN